MYIKFILQYITVMKNTLVKKLEFDILNVTRKHSSNMRSAHLRLPTCFNSHQMSAPVLGGTKVNKFEQVFSGGHQVSPVGGMGFLYSEVPYLGGGELYSPVQCIVTNGHMGLPSSPEQNDRQTTVETLPSCNFVGGR